MTEKLTAAKAALEAKESQEAVDAAQKALDEAVAALEIKPAEPETPDVTTGTYVLMNIPYDQFYAAKIECYLFLKILNKNRDNASQVL